MAGFAPSRRRPPRSSPWRCCWRRRSPEWSWRRCCGAATEAGLLPTAQGALDIAAGLPIDFRGALVVELLAAGDADVDLGATLFQVQAQRHEGEALLLDRGAQAVEF